MKSTTAWIWAAWLSLVASAACSTSSGSSSTSDASTGDAATADCGTKNVRRAEGSTCVATTVTGLCTRDLGYNSATLEYVCAVAPDGTAYVIGVNGDTYLSGDGWTFGPRSLSSTQGTGPYPVEPDSLAPADEARCEDAVLRCSSGEAGVPHDAG